MIQRATIKDIAAEVGVSHTTVSYVLNHNANQKISIKTRNAVLDAAKKLNYIPNETARSLRKDSTECIGVALEKSVTKSRFNGLLQGIRDELSREGYGMMLLDFKIKKGKNHPEYVENVLCRRTDGIIYISSDGMPPDISGLIAQLKVPFVALDCCPDEPELASVSFDYEKGAFDTACRLLGEGAQKILYWSPDVDTLQEEYRLKGLKSAMELYPQSEFISIKMPYYSEYSQTEKRNVVVDDICKQSLMQDIIPLLSHFEENDAVICGWGVMVKHLCLAFHQRNRKDIKIAMITDTDVPVVPGMKILTSRPRYISGGREAAKILLSQIHKQKTENNRVTIAPAPPSYAQL